MGYYRSFMHTLRNPKDHAISSRLGGRTMETPERQKRCDNDFIPRRLLCATENPATGNVSLPVSACNAGKSSREFYGVVLQEEKHFPSLAFTLSTDIESNQPVVVVTQRELANHPPFGLMSRVQVTITGRKYIVHILMRMWESGELDGRDSIHAVCNKFVANTEYKFCPGLDPEEYQKEYFERIRFHIKSVRETTSPFHRVDSVNCVIWFLLAPNARLAEKKSKQVRCGACKRLVTDLNCQLYCQLNCQLVLTVTDPYYYYQLLVVLNIYTLQILITNLLLYAPLLAPGNL